MEPFGTLPSFDVLSVAVTKFSASLSESERKLFAPCRFEDVAEAAMQIQDRLAAQCNLRNLQRISEFLNVLRNLTSALEVFCNEDSILGLIWVS